MYAIHNFEIYQIYFLHGNTTSRFRGLASAKTLTIVFVVSFTFPSIAVMLLSMQPLWTFCLWFLSMDVTHCFHLVWVLGLSYFYPHQHCSGQITTFFNGSSITTPVIKTVGHHHRMHLLSSEFTGPWRTHAALPSVVCLLSSVTGRTEVPLFIVVIHSKIWAFWFVVHLKPVYFVFLLAFFFRLSALLMR